MPQLCALLALLLVSQDLGQAQNQTAGDRLVYATQMATQANSARRRGDFDTAEKYARIAVESLEGARGGSIESRDTVAVLKADLTVLQDQIKTEKKASRRARGQRSLGAKIATTVLVLGILGGAGYYAYDYSQRQKAQQQFGQLTVRR
jgi:hypothetical protein